MIISRAELLLLLNLQTTATDAELALIQLLHAPIERAVKNYVGHDIEQATHVEYLPTTDVAYDSAAMVWESTGDRAYAVGYSGHRRLTLKHRPVRSITSIYEDSAANAGQASSPWPSSTLLTAGTDYWLDLDRTGVCMSGMVIRAGSWSGVARSIKVTYVGGYSAAELNGDAGEQIDGSDIKLAVVEQMAYEFRTKKQSYQSTGSGTGAVKFERLGDYSVSYDVGTSSSSSTTNVSLTQTVKNRLNQISRNYAQRLL